MTKTKRMAECHPEKPHAARGLCNACYQRLWCADHRDKWNRDQLRNRRERITNGQYQEIYAKQKGCCAICGIEDGKVGPRSTNLCIDHNHVTGNIRGLLCRKCNFAIGLLNDSSELLQKAQEYLSLHDVGELESIAGLS